MSPSSDGPDSKGDLRLVEDLIEPSSDSADALTPEAAVDAPEPAQGPPPAQEASTSRFTWLLLALSLLFAWLWLTQVEKANFLAAELAGAQSELAAATANIVAWEEHGASIESGVEGIVSQLGSLQALLAAAPTAGTGSASSGNGSAAAGTGSAPAGTGSASDGTGLAAEATPGAEAGLEAVPAD